MTVENWCICTQANVKLACGGFNASMGVNPDMLSVDGNGNLCTLNGGRPISMGPDYAIKFSYTWSPSSVSIQCHPPWPAPELSPEHCH